MTTEASHVTLGKLDQLRAELVDLAYSLEGDGRLDAADVAIATSARVGELREELEAVLAGET